MYYTRIMTNKKPKSFVLLSGGLDSMLAVRVLQAQGVEVVGLSYESNFYNAERAKLAAAELGIELKIVDIRERILDLVKHPPHGHGKNLNPCIDCHSLMIKLAGEMAREEGIDVIATGEVLGQRPMSQNYQSLEKVKQSAGVDVLRPLSAKLLPMTEVEESGIVDREKLLDIQGRGRQRQTELAAQYGIKDYPSPAGGCLLTEKIFCVRLGEMLKYWPACHQADVELLKFGRVYWLDFDSEKILVMISRDQAEGEALTRLMADTDLLFDLENIPGPTALMRGKLNLSKKEIFDIISAEGLLTNMPIPVDLKDLKLENISDIGELIDSVAKLTAYFSVKARGVEIEMRVK